MRPGGRHFRKTGQYTDDTLQALAVAESLQLCEGFDGSDLVLRLLEGYKKRPEWYGPTSSLFFDFVTRGIPPQRAVWLVHKKKGTSRSNGSVMRGFPLAIYYPSDRVYDVSIACSRLTHYDPVAASCSAWLNGMAADLCRGASRRKAFSRARARCQNPEVLDYLGSYKRYTPEASLDAVLCSHAALCCFMNAKTFENAVLSAINLGGDTDTVGACCGALAGAHWGLPSIPERWRGVLENYDGLVMMAEKLWESRADRSPGQED